MQRLLTAAVTAPLLLAATFLLPWPWFFALMVAAVAVAAVELARILRPFAPGAPLAVLPALVVAAAVALALALATPAAAGVAAPEVRVVAAGLALTLGISSIVLFGRTPVAEALPAVGGLSFGTVYLALPAVALARLHRLDPWLPVLLFAVVFLGDTAAYYVGRRFGRHKMAPVVSPNKSWEGAAASLAAAFATAAVWSWIVDREVTPGIVLLGGAVNAAGQVGDLAESLFKRGSRIKDSGALLPGHGGMLDRIDGLLFAAPVLWIAVVLFR